MLQADPIQAQKDWTYLRRQVKSKLRFAFHGSVILDSNTVAPRSYATPNYAIIAVKLF